MKKIEWQLDSQAHLRACDTKALKCESCDRLRGVCVDRMLPTAASSAHLCPPTLPTLPPVIPWPLLSSKLKLCRTHTHSPLRA